MVKFLRFVKKGSGFCRESCRKYGSLSVLACGLLAIVFLAGCKKKEENPRLDVIRFQSEILGKEMISQVYLPEGYDREGTKEYPILYFLPASGGSSYTVINQFGIMETYDRLISEGEIEPMIIAALGIDQSFAMNTADTAGEVTTATEKVFSCGRYEDYVIDEIIPYIEGIYSVKGKTESGCGAAGSAASDITAKNVAASDSAAADITAADRTVTDSPAPDSPACGSREGRYVGGYSMGGLAALHLAFRNPELFSKVGGHSPTVFTDDFPDITVKEFLYPTEELRKERDPVYLAGYQDLSGLSVYLDTGPLDVNAAGIYVLAQVLEENGVTAELNYFTGSHGFAYCSTYMEEYLKFYGRKEE